MKAKTTELSIQRGSTMITLISILNGGGNLGLVDLTVCILRQGWLDFVVCFAARFDFQEI